MFIRLRYCAVLLILLLLSFGVRSVPEDSSAPKGQRERSGEERIRRILYVDSYTADLPWVQGIMRGISSVLERPSEELPFPLQIRTIHMDTKRNTSEEFKENAALKARELIEDWGPDVVILSDDNAVKYLLVPYYRGSEIPFVFCGVNWDASPYGLPAENVTGMIEVQLIPQLVEAHTKIPTGSWDGWLSDKVLICYATIPEEQGRWAASGALDILTGISPDDIPLSRNREAKVYLNMALARVLGIKFPVELIEHSHIVE